MYAEILMLTGRIGGRAGSRGRSGAGPHRGAGTAPAAGVHRDTVGEQVPYTVSTVGTAASVVNQTVRSIHQKSMCCSGGAGSIGAREMTRCALVWLRHSFHAMEPQIPDALKPRYRLSGGGVH